VGEILFSFFKRPKKPDPRDLEQLIFDIAEHQRDADFHLLYERMVGREVFMPIDRSSLPASIEPGVSYTTTASDRIMMKSVPMPNHGQWATAATLASHSSLAASYVGIQWINFLKMTLQVPELQGALLQGRTSWVGFDRERISYVLARSGV
jgi:hypothetical protein